MPYYSGSKPRYPQKKIKTRLVLFAALGLALMACLAGVAAFLTNEPDGHTYPPEQANPDTPVLRELGPQEAYPQGPLSAGLLFDRLHLEKKTRRLTAFSNGRPVRVYLVALGANPTGPKQAEGDRRTPEGLYHIADKDPDSAYHKSLGISYPNERDRERAAAKNSSPGGNIKIHGLGAEFAKAGWAHRITDWTYGSIALTNQEIEELFTRTDIGTPIEISP
ncbi:MAG: L,D-transpeptidase family protein [Desulfovibrio sp.]|jgi:lipoprotein-anchoring transpeptidase ErfK/SrfK|nr:L,D-transpeptidase family protein [Desulfovibrio sp.]